MNSSPRVFSSPVSSQRAAATCSVTHDADRVAASGAARRRGPPSRCARRAPRTRRDRRTRGPPCTTSRDGALDLRRRDALERALDAARGAPGRSSASISSSAATAQPRDDAGRDAERAPVQPPRTGRRGPGRGACRAIALLPECQHHASLDRSRREARLEHAPDELVEFDAALRAAFGTSEWLVMPGRRVHLEQPRPARAVAHEIHAAPAAAVRPRRTPRARGCRVPARPRRVAPGQMYCVSSATYFAW